MAAKRLHLGDEIPAVLSPNELCALLPYGRSWFMSVKPLAPSSISKRHWFPVSGSTAARW
jgi:hypothetical protein